MTRLGETLKNAPPKSENALEYNMSGYDFMDLTPSLFPGERRYTVAMDLEFHIQWSSHPIRIQLEQARREGSGRQNGAQRCYQSEKQSPMWKMCFLMMECWPTSIVTLEHHLAYELDNGSADNAMLWSAPFCQLMVSVILNDRSGQHAPTIRVYLQYAVICRTNDTSIWPLENIEDNIFLERMIEAINQYRNPRTPIPDIHQEIVRELYGPGSQRKRPESSRVFEQLEKLLSHNNTAPVQQSGWICYKVRASYLKCIVQAFDNTKWDCTNRSWMQRP